MKNNKKLNMKAYRPPVPALLRPSLIIADLVPGILTRASSVIDVRTLDRTHRLHPHSMDGWGSASPSFPPRARSFSLFLAIPQTEHLKMEARYHYYLIMTSPHTPIYLTMCVCDWSIARNVKELERY